MIKIKKQKVNLQKRKKIFSQKRPVRLKVIIKFLIVVMLLSGIGVGLARLKYMFVDSEYFIIKGLDVKLYDEKSGVSRDLFIKEVASENTEGKNIFFVELDSLREGVENDHPEFKDIVIRRRLPNRLVVYANIREAIAQVRSDRYYPVDRDGILLPDVRNFPNPDLPIITGIGINLAKLSSSKFRKFETEKIDKALSLINEASANEDLKDIKLKVVDIIDPGNISFSFEAFNVEIKIGNADFSNRLRLLATVVKQLGDDINNFKYIDLRFDDPILGPR
ncbi:cell division protein FtsQ/DivIB [Candidatus Omnitrophota bacterium]